MRYLIDERDTTEASSFALYRTALSWAASRGDRFVLGLSAGDYDDRADLEALQRLGQPSSSPLVPPGMSGTEGPLGPAFIAELTGRKAPPRATAGDLCPAEIVLVFAGGRTLYALHDYGRTQLLDLSDEELDEVRDALSRAGEDPARIVPAPGPIA